MTGWDRRQRDANSRHPNRHGCNSTQPAAGKRARGSCGSSTRLLIAAGQSRCPFMCGSSSIRKVSSSLTPAKRPKRKYSPATSFLHPYFKKVREWITPEQEVGPQLEELGIHPNHVRWVIMTYFDMDHAGGLHHFPKSEILVMQRAFKLAAGFAGQVRGFLPHRWPLWFAPKLIDLAPELVRAISRKSQSHPCRGCHRSPNFWSHRRARLSGCSGF